MKVKPYQIVIDTNVIVSAMRSRLGASFRLIELIGTGRFVTNLSVALYLEYEDVLRQSDNLVHYTSNGVEDFLDFISGNSNVHDIYFLWRPALKDPGDDFVLELSIASGSEYIVTYNERDFAGAELFGIQTITPPAFLKLLENRDEQLNDN